VLGAPATTTAPPAPVGVGPAPASGGSETGSVAGERIESGSAPTTSTPVVTEPGASNPVVVTPVGTAPTGTEGSIVPAVLPPTETSLPTTPQSTQDDGDTGYTPSERRVTVNAIPELETETYATTDAGEDADGLEPETGSDDSRAFARTPATAWPEDDEVPGDEAPAWGDDREESATSEEPSRETARGVQPDDSAEAPETAERPKPETALEPKPESTPEQESMPEPKPESTPEPKPETTPEPAPDTGEKAEPEPCPPTAEPAPEPEPCPPAAPEPQPAPEQVPPAPEQAPATPPC
jgi:hypothetical protein